KSTGIGVATVGDAIGIALVGAGTVHLVEFKLTEIAAANRDQPVVVGNQVVAQFSNDALQVNKLIGGTGGIVGVLTGAQHGAAIGEFTIAVDGQHPFRKLIGVGGAGNTTITFYGCFGWCKVKVIVSAV